MAQALLRFYAELNDFLPRARRQLTFAHRFSGRVAVKDMIEAFAGDKKSFDKPVIATIGPGDSVKIVGFVTRESLENLGLEDHVAVYMPQSYNFAGNLLVVPRRSVRPLPADSKNVMALIVSGGVSAGGDETESNGDRPSG